MAGRGHHGLSAAQALPPEGFAARCALLLELLRDAARAAGARQPGDHPGARGVRGPLPGGIRGLRGGAAATGRGRAPGLPAADQPRGSQLALLDGADGAGAAPGGAGAGGRAGAAEEQWPGRATTAAWEALVARYGGNPLALRVVGETIDVVFGGDIAAFLAQECDGLRRHPAAAGRAGGAPVRAGATIGADLAGGGAGAGGVRGAGGRPGAGGGAGEVVEAVEALRRRSLLEPGARGTFTLQPVVLEYADRRGWSRRSRRRSWRASRHCWSARRWSRRRRKTMCGAARSG